MSASSTSKAPRIVAGVDGSPSSRAGLRWAVREAALIGGTVDAVMALHFPPTTVVSGVGAGYGEPGTGGVGQSLAEVDENVTADQTRHVLDAVINEELKPDDKHLVRARVFNGHPAEALLAAADDADMLVVGNRGRGGFAEILLGSVGQYLVHHANCPVLIFRGPPVT
jgi:nucleotide-binding universal stress UspA family protein